MKYSSVNSLISLCYIHQIVSVASTDDAKNKKGQQYSDHKLLLCKYEFYGKIASMLAIGHWGQAGIVNALPARIISCVLILYGFITS